MGERFLDENFNEKKKLKNYKFYKKNIFSDENKIMKFFIVEIHEKCENCR